MPEIVREGSGGGSGICNDPGRVNSIWIWENGMSGKGEQSGENMWLRTGKTHPSVHLEEKFLS